MASEKIAASTVAAGRTDVVTHALWVDGPFPLASGEWVARSLAAHPPMEQRIAWRRALEGASASAGR